MGTILFKKEVRFMVREDIIQTLKDTIQSVIFSVKNWLTQSRIEAMDPCSLLTNIRDNVHRHNSDNKPSCREGLSGSRGKNSHQVSYCCGASQQRE